MSTLLNTFQSQTTEALKSGDRVRVETLRFLLSAIRNQAIAKYGNRADLAMTDKDVLDVIKKQVKSHQESIEAFIKAGRRELADAEKSQLAILQSYLPKQISDEELKEILEPIVASGENNFGILMAKAMAAIGGRADGSRVSSMLKQLI